MLKSLKKSREQKVTQKADELINKGIMQLDGKLYKQAMIEFQNAYQLDPKTVESRLNKEFSHYLEILDHEAALSIGLILLKIRKADFELANQVGNCARKQKNYKQANNLYRYALKINKNYPIAFYNLAASMGKVEKYDADVKRSLKVFAEIKDYILPEYIDDPEFESHIGRDFLSDIQKRSESIIKKYEKQIIEKENQNELQEARVLRMELEKYKRSSDGATELDYKEYIKRLLPDEDDSDEYEENGDQIADSQAILKNLYNFGIFALKQNKSSAAILCFKKVKELGGQYKYLDMLIAISMAVSGKTKEAISFFVDSLGEEQYNRFFNINLGFMYKSIGNRLLATKYLAIGAELLEKSDGLYHLSDLISIADQNLEDGNFRKALKLYKVVISENDDIDIWSKIGQIYINLKKYEEATKAFREILRIDPESSHAHQQLRQLHDIFCARAESFFHHSKYQAAASMYEKAMRILRLPDTIKQASSIYKVLNNTARFEALTKEYEQILAAEREAESEKQRLENIKIGKMHIKKKNYKLGIEYLEMAFRMKVDKDVFILLASIYKSLKRKEDMQDLLNRWNKMVEYEEKMRKFMKEEERNQLRGSDL